MWSFVSTLWSCFRTRVSMEIEILALRRQLAVLQRRTKKRPSLRTADRVLWVILSRVWAQWCMALVIVKPATVIAWQRKGFRLYWRWKSWVGKCGRPCAGREIRELIRKMSTVNSLWDSRRIAKTRNSARSSNGSEVYGASSQATLANVAHFS